MFWASIGNQPAAQEESWAVFDTEKVASTEVTNTKSPRGNDSSIYCIFFCVMKENDVE